MPRSNDRLSTTAHAILGHLALRPWSAYELTRSMRRSLHWFWPRAESRIYEQARRLVEIGLAETRTERVGDRLRTIYSVTGAGRTALAAYLRTPSTTTTYHFEPLLRVHLAEFGTKEDAMRAIDEATAYCQEVFRDGLEVATMYAEQRHPLQRDAHVRALVFDHLLSIAVAVHDWAERSRREIARWDDLEPTEAKLRRGNELMRRSLAKIPATGRDAEDPG